MARGYMIHARAQRFLLLHVDIPISVPPLPLPLLNASERSIDDPSPHPIVELQSPPELFLKPRHLRS